MDKLSIAVIAYKMPKYLYVCLDGISRLQDRDEVATRVYVDGGISSEARRLTEEVLSEYDFAEAFFAESNLGILKNTARALHHSCQFAESVLYLEEDHLIRPDALIKIRETEKDGFFLSLCGRTEGKSCAYRAKGNVVDSEDFEKLYSWIQNAGYVGKKCPVTGRVLDASNTSHDVVFNIYLHEHGLKTHFIKGFYVAHFGIIGSNFRLHSNTPDLNKEVCQILFRMFSGDKEQWLSNVADILHKGNFSSDLRLRLWPAGFSYEGRPATEPIV